MNRADDRAPLISVVIDVADGVTSQGEPGDAHIDREAHNFLFIDDELALETWLGSVGINRALLDLLDRHAVETIIRCIVEKNLCLAEAQQLRQVSLDLQGEAFERAIQDEGADKADDSALHGVLLLQLQLVGEDLHTSARQSRYYLAHDEVVGVPHATELIIAPAEGLSIGFIGVVGGLGDFCGLAAHAEQCLT